MTPEKKAVISQSTLVFTKTSARSLKKAYTQAVIDSKDTFVWEGKLLDTGYARYLLEHLNNQFKEKL
jgi:hypothetical protein